MALLQDQSVKRTARLCQCPKDNAARRTPYTHTHTHARGMPTVDSTQAINGNRTYTHVLSENARPLKQKLEDPSIPFYEHDPHLLYR